MVIFVSSIGRSGTRYLANLFASCTTIPSYHIAEPYCHGDVQRDICNGKRRAEVPQKAKIIAKIEREQGSYFESTQVFIRVLAEDFLSRFPSISVVHLLRDPEEVARSYVNRESYPSHCNRPWRLPLNTRSALLKSPPNLSPFQENLCDWLDNELHYHTLQGKFTRTVDLLFSDFGNPPAIESFFSELGVTCDAKKIRQHTAARDLDRNANKLETRVTDADRQEMQSLASTLLSGGLDASVFRQDVYRRFSFLQALTGLSS
jgi:hypothetical protein